MESKSLNNIIKLKNENKLSNIVNIVVISCEDDAESDTNFKMCQELGLNISATQVEQQEIQKEQ